MAMIPWWIHYPNVNNEIINLDWILQISNENTDKIENFIGINTIKYADPILWDITSQYEANTIVVDPQTGDAYISTKAVPYGVALSNDGYWTRIYNYASELHVLREQIAADEQLSTTASAPRSVDDLVFVNGLLYRVTAPMIAGDSYVVDSNCVKTTINAELLRLHTSISAEAEARAEADTAEAEARAEADTALGGRITDEAEARAEADTTLGGRITDEAEARADADTALGGRITDEAQTRADADTAIINRIEDTLKWGFNFSRCIFIGDSYMESAYLPTASGFVSLFCNHLRITNYTMYGRSGSGFINNGGTGGHGTFFDILENEVIPNETNPNEVTFILIEGGANDGAPTFESYSALVESWIEDASSAFPNAKIAVMETPTFDVILNNTRLGLKRACETTQAAFIDSGLWLTGNTLLEAASPNADHPNADGMKVIAQNLANTMIASDCKGYFRTTMPKVEDADVTINAAYFIVDGDTLTMIVNGGINNKATRYVPILNWPEHFYNHIGRFEGVAYTGLGTSFPIWLTETSIQLDTLSATAKSTDFQFTITTSVTGLFGIT